MFEVGKTYKNVDGEDVRIICIDKPGEYPMVGIVGDCIGTFTLDGRLDSCVKSGNDLIPPEKSIYVVENHAGSIWICYGDNEKDIALRQYGKRSGQHKPIYRYVRKERME